MSERIETKKFALTVEGETEKWYLEWLQRQINSCPERSYDVSLDARVQQSPRKFYKSASAITTPRIYHICDVESLEPYHVEKFKRILSEMKEAKEQKGIIYTLDYSNYTFELWIILHKRDCNGPIAHRRQYLEPINQAFGEHFEDLEHFKREDNFKRCLSRLSLADVKSAIRRSAYIMRMNSEDRKTQLQYKGYRYFRDNPSLTIHEAVEMILKECGLLGL